MAELKILRWVLAAPGAIAAWYATFFFGIVAHEAAEKALCPAGKLVSGICTSDKVQQLLEVLIVIFIALSAIAVVGTAVAIAPSHKAAVAWVTFGAGAIVAVFFAFATHMYFGGTSAIATGLATTLAITMYLKLKNRNTLPGHAT